jgi:putative ABC transport system ATP-binding protein
MLEIRNVGFSYSKDPTIASVLDNINVQFYPGKLYSIFGPSGSGKTTLLSIIGGLEKPNSGSVMIDNKTLDDIGESNVRKKHVSFVFQNYLLFPYLSAIENVVVAMDICHKEKSDKRKKAKEILLSLDLNEKDIARRVRKLSGGQQQRVAIARALAAETQYILADEPTGNLDKKTSVGIIEIFKELVRIHNKCVIVVTHSNIVRTASDISFKLSDGRLTLLTSEEEI